MKNVLTLPVRFAGFALGLTFGAVRAAFSALRRRVFAL